MFRVDKVIKPWKDSAALNDRINLYGFWNETAFITKSGDLGKVLQVSGVDYESLDRAAQEYATKRLEAALKAFAPGFHVYQCLFKSNKPDIPFAHYDDPVVEAAIEQRRQFFEAKKDDLYQVEIFYAILVEGSRSKTGIRAAIAQLLQDPAGAIGELKAQFTNNAMKVLLRSHIEQDLGRLDQRVQVFVRQLTDLIRIEVLDVVSNFCFVHPAKAGISSNLNLITDKGNIYSFTLQDVSAAATAGQADLKVLVEPADRSALIASSGPAQFVRRSN